MSQTPPISPCPVLLPPPPPPRAGSAGTAAAPAADPPPPASGKPPSPRTPRKARKSALTATSLRRSFLVFPSSDESSSPLDGPVPILSDSLDTNLGVELSHPL